MDEQMSLPFDELQELRDRPPWWSVKTYEESRPVRPANDPSVIVRPTMTGRRWVALCSCGYTSTTRATKDDCFDAARHHIRKHRKEMTRASGW